MNESTPPAPPPVALVEPAEAPTPMFGLGTEQTMRVKPLMGIPAPDTQTRASAVPAYSAPLSFDWRGAKPPTR
jgi:hypothetical protein